MEQESPFPGNQNPDVGKGFYISLEPGRKIGLPCSAAAFSTLPHILPARGLHDVVIGLVH